MIHTHTHIGDQKKTGSWDGASPCGSGGCPPIPAHQQDRVHSFPVGQPRDLPSDAAPTWPGTRATGPGHLSFSFARRPLSGCSDRRPVILPGAGRHPYSLAAHEGLHRRVARTPSRQLAVNFCRSAVARGPQTRFPDHTACKLIDPSEAHVERLSRASVAYVQQPKTRQREACSLNQRVRLP